MKHFVMLFLFVLSSIVMNAQSNDIGKELTSSVQDVYSVELNTLNSDNSISGPTSIVVNQMYMYSTGVYSSGVQWEILPIYTMDSSSYYVTDLRASAINFMAYEPGAYTISYGGTSITVIAWPSE